MENWRSYKFFDGWIMKKIEHTYNFNFKNKYRRNQPVSECKYTYCCDSLDNTLSLCEETSFYSSETPSMRKDRRKLRRKKLVKKVRRNEDRYRRYSSSESEEEYRRRRKNYQRIFIHQKIIYDEYITKKDRKFYPTRLKMLSQERWSEELPKKKEKEEKNDLYERVDEKEEKNEGTCKREKEEPKIEKDEKEGEREVKEENSRPYPPPPLAQPPLPPPPLPPPPPPPPPPPLPPPPAVRLVAVNSSGYLPMQQMTAARPTRPYNEQLPYGTIAGIAYEIPVDITYIIGCNAMFRQF